ncbi:FAD-dependent pyridine nucleotide-disulphide oxidoreductase [Pseudarthrobacter chlorophenolicus A6]|uniref:FAD-dependent pyridine nucleotide-disulphide oxidoreductase n=1 Tax=Pseudarthrobacter chlorophenolicus (strain ATCC 700700 / DSM 12829 / CIP 107037 / JCM 12360 / KCTC 9906 / NCIMB 13794 / A6) TaxID=452863 RepID=B8HCQ1_PSECP|nr:FAD-dependent oxidoreductase [Pseudarthrobacter chlorophenolicus]ACL38834.1 FAD-dependent pyridine nucleotide-disulphide oxidoreductase [Pseudarthrobacter chlorophenolicus A6]SDR08123.1 NADH dehydrogenase [Pseudarthrobacter chlorophenolicus]
MDDTYQVIVVGGGFAGKAAAQELGRKGTRVLLIDANNYHQFQPLLYQVASSQIGVSAVARPLRAVFRNIKGVRVLTAEVTAVDAAARTVTTADGTQFQAQVLVLATGAVPNFFNTTGADKFAYPLYSVADATRLSAALTEALDEADRGNGDSPDVVVVGGGPTGVETAGALAENVKYIVPKYFSSELAARCHVHLVDMVPNVLMAFSEKSQAYTRDRLVKLGVQLHMGQSVTEVRPDGVTLADGTVLPAPIVVWAGGLQAGKIIAESGLTQGKGGRIDVLPDLTAPGVEGVYVLGDSANITDAAGARLPQLGSVAQQSGKWAAKNIHADLTGGTRQPFRYLDKGYMAMVGRGAAVAELGPQRIQLQGPLAFLSWLGVHLALLPGVQQKVRALFSWAVGYVTHSPSQVVVGRPD